MSRHRDIATLCYSEENFSDFSNLQSTCGREHVFFPALNSSIIKVTASFLGSGPRGQRRERPRVRIQAWCSPQCRSCDVVVPIWVGLWLMCPVLIFALISSTAENQFTSGDEAGS